VRTFRELLRAVLKVKVHDNCDEYLQQYYLRQNSEKYYLWPERIIGCWGIHKSTFQALRDVMSPNNPFNSF
jgi:hypothetical protein